MKVIYPPSAVTNLIDSLSERIAFARELSNAAGARGELLELYTKVHVELDRILTTIDTNKFQLDYTGMLAKNLEKLAAAFPRSYGSSDRTPIVLQESEILTFRNQQERDQTAIEKAIVLVKASSDFFIKLDFLNRDLVIVGANGSGKTFLANSLLRHVHGNGVLISSQRLLHIPEIDNISSHTITSEALKKIQTIDKTTKNAELGNFQEEFGVLIHNLLAEDAVAHKEYKRKATENSRRGIPIESPTLTNLEKTIEIWNTLFTHIQISIEDGHNIQANSTSGAYPAVEMSEGEKVTLFLIAQVLQSPPDGFVIVDEPEMYLHPTIHRKLWDRMEIERPDAIFIYMTHDLEFASSRSQAKKLWLKSFVYPDHFHLEEIFDNDIPTTLLMELLGSRQDIAFCEGVAGSLDEQVYGILLPGYHITPVGGCLSVISFTKAFNKLPYSSRKAIGIIDGDFISEKRRSALQRENIFAITFPDVENILLDEVVLRELANTLSVKETQVDKVKTAILQKLDIERDIEIAKYVSAKIDHYFKDTNVSAGDSLDAVQQNFKRFTEEINIDMWARQRGESIDEVVKTQNYSAAIGIFKNKGLSSIVNVNFGIKNFIPMAIALLKQNSELQNHLKRNLQNAMTPLI